MSKNILINITASISAYKALELISMLRKENHNIEVCISKNALNFIGKASIEGLTGKSPFVSSYEDSKMMAHIELARWAHIILLYPASAKTINQMSQGIGEGIIFDIFMANNFIRPYIIAPAMNTQMLINPITQKSMQRLKEYGCQILDTEEGVLACGEKGKGKLLSPDKVLGIINKMGEENESAHH